MSEANVVFTLDGVNLTIQCTTEDKMKDICKKYSTKININMDSLFFLYRGNKVNFDKSFKEQANIIDMNVHEMKILVNKNADITNSIHNNIISIKSNLNSENADCLKNENILDNIKSIYFSKILFSYLEEKLN